MVVDQQLARALLTGAVERYESAGRWALVACLALFVFHVMTFGPFVRAQAERASAAEQKGILGEAAKQVAASLDAQQAAMAELQAELERMLTAKRADFEELQRAVGWARGGGELAPDGLPSPPGLQAPVPNLALQQPPGPMVQMPLPAAEAAVWAASPAGRDFRRLIAAEGALEAVRAASSDDALREALRPLVDRHIIGPRFEALNASWRTLLPTLREQAERTKAHLEAAAGLVPGGAPWPAMMADIDRYLASLDGVVFQPPSDPGWWHSVMGKVGVVVEMREEAARQIASPASFRDAAAALNGLLDSRAELVGALDARLEELQRQFDSQQQRLAELIVPIRGVALDLSILVGSFPFVLGILLGVALVWPARRYGELSRALWLANRAELVDAPAQAALRQSGSRGLWLVQTAGLPALFIAWVLVAAWQLSAWQARDGLSLALLTGAGAAVVIASAAYRAWVMGPAAARAPQQAAS